MDQGHRSVLVLALAGCCAAPIVPQAMALAGPADHAASAAADSSTDLAPTSAVPWNPSRAVPAHESWEEALNAPLTLISLPVRAIGAATEAGLLHVQQNSLIPRTRLLLALAPKVGLTLRPASLGDRTGLGAAMDFTPPQLGGRFRAGLDASTGKYSRGRVELGPRWLLAVYTTDWRPQQPYFGSGSDSRQDDATSYAARSQRAELRLRLLAGRRVRGEFGAWIGERQAVLRNGRDQERPSFEGSFPPGATGLLDVRQQHFVNGARAALDTREGAPHWSRGLRVAAQAERYGRTPDGRPVLFDGSDASPGFWRYTIEGQTGWSFMRDPRTIRLSARVVDVAPFDGARPPTLLDLSRLGGGAGLAGFEPGRFHGLDLFVARLGYLFPIAQYAELEIASEAGMVSGDVWRETRLDGLEQSYTVMLRPRTERAPLGAVGVSWSRESVRVGFSLGGVE